MRSASLHGAELTPLRRMVLEILLRNDGPMRAYDLIDALGRRLGRRISPPTIYRALEFLQSRGFALKIETCNAFMALETGRKREGALLLCRACGSAALIEIDGMGGLLEEKAKEFGFRVERPVLEIQGSCASCRAAEAPAP